MESSKKKHIDQIVDSVDRLSNLPDAVLCHILSFLPTKFSVATSILSRRWRSIWADVPTLYFDDCYHHYMLDVNHLLKVISQYRVQNMNSFLLFYSGYDLSEVELESLINAAIVRKVETLHLSLARHVSLPDCVFTCTTIVDLTLEVCNAPTEESTVFLPSLKRLHLFSLSYFSYECLPHLLSGCPVLEELTVDHFVDLPYTGGCFISSPTIKSLVLVSAFYDIFGSKESHNVTIDAPALRYLRFHDYISEDISVGSLTCLIEADVAFKYDVPEDAEEDYSLSMLEFVGRLCNVKCLKLSMTCIKVPNSTLSALTVKFDNLTKLELDADWLFISYFLENANNLEVLIIEVDLDMMDSWMEPYQVPTCLLSHLRTIRIVQMGCTEVEFNVVRYLLRNGKVMERMEIYFRNSESDSKAKCDALRRISLFPRGSEACELSFN